MEITGMIMALICFVVVFPIAIVYLFYSKWRKYLWLAPTIGGSIISTITFYIYAYIVKRNVKEKGWSCNEKCNY